MEPQLEAKIAAVQMPHSQGYNSPLFFVKDFQSGMDDRDGY